MLRVELAAHRVDRRLRLLCVFQRRDAEPVCLPPDGSLVLGSLEMSLRSNRQPLDASHLHRDPIDLGPHRCHPLKQRELRTRLDEVLIGNLMRGSGAREVIGAELEVVEMLLHTFNRARSRCGEFLGRLMASNAMLVTVSHRRVRVLKSIHGEELVLEELVERRAGRLTRPELEAVLKKVGGQLEVRTKALDELDRGPAGSASALVQQTDRNVSGSLEGCVQWTLRWLSYVTS